NTVNLKSSNIGLKRGYVNFLDKRTQDTNILNNIVINWIDNYGNEIYQDTIFNDTFEIRRASYVGHVFSIREENTNKLLGLYQVSDLYNEIYLTITDYGICFHDKLTRYSDYNKISNINQTFD